MGEGSNTRVCCIVKGQRSFVKVKPLEANLISYIIIKIKCVQFFFFISFYQFSNFFRCSMFYLDINIPSFCLSFRVY